MSDATDIAARRAHLSDAIADAAARRRFSTRRRRFDAGFAARRSDRLRRLFTLTTFVLLVLVPGLLGAYYFGLVASDRYVSEARFLLAPNMVSIGEGAGRMGGAPPIEIARDTQVVAEYLRSRSLAAALEREVGLRARYAAAAFDLDALRPGATPDWISGLASDATDDDLADYWADMTDTWIAPSSGIVSFEVAAFDPEDARRLADAALARAEALVNEMNARVWADAVRKAEELFAEATRRLGRAEAALARARDAEGVLDGTAAAAALTGVASDARSTLVALEQERAVKRGSLDADSPLIRALDRRIESLREQIALIEGSIAGESGGGEGGRTLTSAIEGVAAFEAEAEVAERQFLAASERLEIVRALSEAQMLYLNVFVEPAAPNEARLPRRGWWIAGMLAVGLLLWGGACALFSLLRRKLG